MANLLNCKKILFIALIIVSEGFFSDTIFCQNFAPQAGLENSTAIESDNSIFVNWAKRCYVHRGFVNISDTLQTYNGTNKASFGADSLATGFPGGIMDVVSLGDSGFAILTFQFPIKDEAGADFAVFENGIKNQTDENLAFLELAFVEVSSDSIHFFRFPNESTTPFSSQVSSFDNLDARNINNLAGKYVGNYGTPFDLSELKNINPFVDLNNIKYVKIIDAIGSISPKFASFDSYNNIINDPFPTPFNSCGFDLDAIGVIHQNITFNSTENNVTIFPNPAVNTFYIKTENETIKTVQIYNLSGKIISLKNYNSSFVEVNISSYNEVSIYLVKILTDKNCYTEKLIHIKQ